MNEKTLEALRNFKPTKEDVAEFARILKEYEDQFNETHCGLELTVEEKIWRAQNGYFMR